VGIRPRTGRAGFFLIAFIYFSHIKKGKNDQGGLATTKQQKKNRTHRHDLQQGLKDSSAPPVRSSQIGAGSDRDDAVHV
jgi:hypothetical protein